MDFKKIPSLEENDGPLMSIINFNDPLLIIRFKKNIQNT